MDHAFVFRGQKPQTPCGSFRRSIRLWRPAGGRAQVRVHGRPLGGSVRQVCAQVPLIPAFPTPDRRRVSVAGHDVAYIHAHVFVRFALGLPHWFAGSPTKSGTEKPHQNRHGIRPILCFSADLTTSSKRRKNSLRVFLIQLLLRRVKAAPDQTGKGDLRRRQPLEPNLVTFVVGTL